MHFFSPELLRSLASVLIPLNWTEDSGIYGRLSHFTEMLVVVHTQQSCIQVG